MSQAIDIRIAGESIDLPPDIQITLDLVSPLFQDEIGGGSQSFNFSLPDSPTNRKIFGNADLVLLSERVYPDFSCDLYLFGLPWMVGAIQISAAGNGFTASLKMQESDLISRMEDQRLRTLELGGIRTITTNTGLDGINDMLSHANDTVANPVNHDYVFAPIRNPDAYQGKRPAPPGGAEVHNDYLNYYRDDSFRDEVQELINATSGQCTLIPFPKLIYVIGEAFNELGEQMIDTDFWTDTEIGDLVIHSLISLDRYADASIAASFPINALAKTISIPNHLPDISFRELVGGITRLFCLAMIRTSDGIEIESRKDILASVEMVDWSKKQGQVFLYSMRKKRNGNSLLHRIQTTPSLQRRKNKLQELAPANQVSSFAESPLHQGIKESYTML